MIDWFNCILTSFSMSIDAMSVNAANGLLEKDMKIRKMILISLSFGLFQFMMPVIGYFIGHSFEEKLKQWIPFIAFGLLTCLSVKSFVDWFLELRRRKKQMESGEQDEVNEKRLCFMDVLIQSIATSIDALCIGFVYMEYTIPSALIVFSIIGVTTFTLSFLSVFLAKKVAGPLEKWAGLFASLIFLGIGLKILLEGIL